MPSRSPYLDVTLGSASRLLSALDREPHSATYGSFDREHWAWKFRDWPRGMLQNSLHPVALLWRHPFEGSPFVGNARLLEWLCAAIDVMLRRQRNNGAVDAFAPNDQDPGVTLMAVYNLSEALRIVSHALPGELLDRARRCIARGCEFADRRDESHGFVSNHWATFALAWHNAGELLSESRYQARAEAVVARILSEQSSEGWYREYEGPDAGYESLGIYYLAKYWSRTSSPQLLDSLKRSVGFFSHFVHPDGSVGGAYGSRHTSLYFPAGFELLAPRIPLAAAVASFMRARIARGNVVTPACADPENLSPLTASYLEAAALNSSSDEGDGLATALPCTTLNGARDFPESGIRVFGSPAYYAVWHGRKGGVCRIHDRGRGALAYDDAGYLVRSGKQRWISQVIGMSHCSLGRDAERCTSNGTFTEWRQPIPTPWNFLALRILNLTLFRSTAFGQLLRNWIVRQLILSKSPGPFRFSRSVNFGEYAVDFEDALERTRGASADAVTWARALTGIHMGSAKYFHPTELEASAEPPALDMARDLNQSGRTVRTFRLTFEPTSCPARPSETDQRPASLSLTEQQT